MIKNEDRISKDLQGLPEAKPFNFSSTEFLSDFEKTGLPYKPKGLSNQALQEAKPFSTKPFSFSSTEFLSDFEKNRFSNKLKGR
jgi:hypothetical protein